MWGGAWVRGPMLTLHRTPDYKSPANKERKVLTPVPKSTGIKKRGMPQLLR